MKRRKAVAGGILMNSELITVSGCKVMFDKRSTNDAHDTRSERNGIAEGRAFRKAAWEAKQADKRMKERAAKRV